VGHGHSKSIQIHRNTPVGIRIKGRDPLTPKKQTKKQRGMDRELNKVEKDCPQMEKREPANNKKKRQRAVILLREIKKNTRKGMG